MMLDYRGYAPGFLETFTDNIAKVTAEDVQTVAQKYLHPDALTIVTVGNQENFDRPLSEFGDVNEIEIKQPEPPPEEPIPEASDTDIAKAKEIVAAAVKAHGGLENLTAVKNAVSESNSTVTTPAGKADMQVKFVHLYPDKLRQDVETPQGKMSYVFDGDSVYLVSSMGTQPLPPEISKSFNDSVFRENIPLLINLAQNAIPVQFSGTEEVQSNPATVLLVKQPSGVMLKIYVSEQTNLVVKYVFSETEQGVTLNKEAIFSEYRDVDGVKMPYHIVQNVNGNHFIENRISSIKFNTEIDETLFEISE